jgi:hypothetical protein
VTEPSQVRATMENGPAAPLFPPGEAPLHVDTSVPRVLARARLTARHLAVAENIPGADRDQKAEP